MASNKQSTGLSKVLIEIAILKKLDHPNIVKLIEVIDDAQADRLYVVMEYLEKGPLMKEVVESNPIPMVDAWGYWRDLVRAVDYLHENNIVHSDIKPSNCLITTDGSLKLADFGVSCILDSLSSDLIKIADGSPAYTPPEVVAGSKLLSGRAADIWMLGATLFQIIFGKVPFFSNCLVDLYKSILSCELTFPSNIDPLLKDLLTRLLCKDPGTRITMSAIKEHPFTTDEGNAPLDDVYDLIELNEGDVDTAVKKYTEASMIHKKNASARLSLLVSSPEDYSRRSSLIPKYQNSPSLRPVGSVTDFHLPGPPQSYKSDPDSLQLDIPVQQPSYSPDRSPGGFTLISPGNLVKSLNISDESSFFVELTEDFDSDFSDDF
ncbi:hypothetical protein GEMRC1_010564 [Eukaryota sp. GEM-RC1]